MSDEVARLRQALAVYADRRRWSGYRDEWAGADYWHFSVDAAHPAEVAERALATEPETA